MSEGPDKEKPCFWMSKCDLKISNEALICSAQEYQIVSGCSKLALREYKRRHGNVASMIHWKLSEKCNLEKSEKWYLHNLLLLKMSATN